MYENYFIGCYKDLISEKCLVECLANSKLVKKKKKSVGYPCYITTVNVLILSMECNIFLPVVSLYF